MTEQIDPVPGEPGRFTNWRRREVIELVLAVMVVAATSVHLLRFVRIAWNVSLWNDEIFSVVRYSGPGPGHAVTHYGSANNHVFFNLVNALTPGAGSVDPARARWWSIVAVLATQAVVLAVFWRRRWFLVGAVFFGLLATNPDWLDLVLQARGYGFLGLAAVLSSAAVWRYLASPGWGPLAALWLVTVAGTWTVPSYVLFAGPLWLGLLVAVRRREVVVGGTLAAAAIVAVYLPVLDGLRHEASTYEEQWGRSYTSLSDVADTVGTYLLRPSLLGGGGTALVVALGAIGLAVVLVVSGVRLLPVAAADRSLVLVLAGAVTAFFAANLYLGTAVLRTTAFVVVPIGFALAVVVGDLVERLLSAARPSLTGGSVPRRLSSVALALAALTVLGVLVPEGIERPSGPFYLPAQDWQGAARQVERTFPDGTGVGSTGPPSGLFRVTTYLDVDRHPAAPEDPAGSPALAAGRTVLIDMTTTGEPSFDFEQVAPVWSETRLRQRIGRYVRVLAAPPEDPHLAEVTVDGRQVELAPLTDRMRSSGLTLPPEGATVRIVPPPGQVTRSVVMVADGDIRPVRSMALSVDGRAEPVGWGDVSWFGPSLTVSLGDRRIDALEVVFDAEVPDTDPDGADDLREVWTYPAG